MQPDVSVLLFVRDSRRYRGLFEQALTSVVNQRGVGVQLCAVDNGSTDDTYDRLVALSRAWPLTIPVHVARHETPRSADAAMDTAMAQAQGRYAILLSARSWYEPGSLAALVAALDAQPDAGFAYGATQYHGAQTDLYRPPPFDPAAFLAGFPSRFGYLFRREAWDRGCRFDTVVVETPDGPVGIGDRDFAVQMIYDLGWRALALPEVLVLHYHYDGHGQLTNLLAAHRAEIDAQFNARWAHVMEGAR